MILSMNVLSAARRRRDPVFHGSCLLLGCVVGLSVACDSGSAPPKKLTTQTQPLAEAAAANHRPATGKNVKNKRVGYDLRVSRPGSRALTEVFDRHLARAKAENKQLAVLFSAEWCKACGELDLELGNLHEAARIGDVRIVKLVEEEWKAVARLDEFNALRGRWVDEMWSYPLLVVLDGQGKAIEDMAAAKDRFEAAGVEANLPDWFDDLRGRGWKRPT